VRVGINLLAFGPRAGGVGRYVRELAPAMLAERPELELHLFVPSDAPDWTRELAMHPRVALTRLRQTSSNRTLLYLAQLVGLADLARRARCDVLHGPANFVPLLGRLPRVVTIHDVMWIEHAELSGFTPFAARVWGRLTAACARAAQRVVADTEATAADLERLLGVPRGSVDVVLLGAGIEVGTDASSEDDVRTRFGLVGARVLLSVGQKRPHKNIEVVLRALAELPSDVILVAPGADHGHGDNLRALAREIGVADRVRLPSWIDDADLEGLYRLAHVDVQMSLMEGFGLPALEAMQRGVPTVVSTTPALVEAVGDAAVVVEPHDYVGVAAAISRLLGDPAYNAEFVARGHRRCGDLTWSRTARETLASYDRALARR
jgi:glycosyltransferase involved in cell wall biosynthesis